jgi:hypothetical protein
MENNKKTLNGAFIIIAVILGIAVFKEFDFETFRFKKLGLGIVYLLTFIASIYLLMKGKNSEE